MRDSVESMLWSVLCARRTRLERRSVFSIAHALGRLSSRWLDRKFVYRRAAAERLSCCSHLSPRAAEALLDALFGALSERHLRTLLYAEFNDPRVLDEFRFDRKRRAWCSASGPALVTHVFPSNIPNPAVTGIVFSMLIKSASAARPSSRDAGILDIYLESLRKHDAALGGVNFLVDPRDAGALERCVKQSGLVTAYGDSPSLEAVRRLVPAGVPFVAYGPKLSFALYAREALRREKALALFRETARDIWMADQRGCLSPVWIFIEKGGGISADEFAEGLAASLEWFHRHERTASRSSWTRRAAQARLFQDKILIQRLTGRAARFFESGQKGAWAISLEELSKEKGLPLFAEGGGQLVRIFVFEGTEDLFRSLAPLRNRVQGVALECSNARRTEIARALAELGASLVTRAGRLQFPSALWHHDGKLNLASWVQWTDLET